MKAKEIIEHFKMQAHPEGGHFLETYKSALTSNLGEPFHGERSFSTAIYFLLQKGEFSAFHKIKSDEIWHHYMGDSLEVIEIDSNQNLIRTRIGTNLTNGEVPQYCVQAGHMFASRTLGEFSLVGCTVSPGFDFADFEMPNQETLIQMFPDHQEIIKELSR